jgi:hypothetical protein
MKRCWAKIGISDLRQTGDRDVKRIGITADLPVKFKELVKSQFGEDYDEFQKLEELCKSAKDVSGKEYKEAKKIT